MTTAPESGSVWTPSGPPVTVIRDQSELRVEFNVMPGKPVREEFYVREYRIWPRYIEAEFDRTYMSSMAHSPSHVIFLTALVHCQKMLYVYLCHELGFSYEPNGPERLKIWPTKMDIRLPDLVTPEIGLVHRMQVRDVRRIDARRLKVEAESRINNSLSIVGESPVFLV